MATGMEKEDKEDYGIVEAASEYEAKIRAIMNKEKHDSFYIKGFTQWEWLLGCLIAKEIKD